MALAVCYPPFLKEKQKGPFRNLSLGRVPFAALLCPKDAEGRLERLLGFYGECVDVHIVVFLGSVSVEALSKALAMPSEPAILTGFVRTLAASS